MEIWVSVVGIYRIYGLGFLSVFITSIEKKTEKNRLVERFLSYSDTYLIDNLIHFIGSPTRISHTLQVGSRLAQGEGSEEHREEYLQETEGSMRDNSDYRATGAQLSNVQVFLVHPFQEN